MARLSSYELKITLEAKAQIKKIMNDPSKTGLQKQLKKAFRNLKRDPKYPALKSHPFQEVDGIKIWTSYVQNKTPQAYRILWHYGDEKLTIVLLSVIPTLLSANKAFGCLLIMHCLINNHYLIHK